MKSPSTSLPDRGFTLIEMLIVMGIVAVLASIPLFIDLNSYRGYAFRSERDKLVTTLQTARMYSMNNINQLPHGVALYPTDHQKSFVFFEGANYAAIPSSHIVTDVSYELAFGVGTPPEVVFSQLDGNANYEGDVVLIDTTRNFTFVIAINHEGAISW